jgi:hypothetical protein
MLSTTRLSRAVVPRLDRRQRPTSSLSKFSDHISGGPKLSGLDLLEALSERLVQTRELVVAHVVLGLGQTQLDLAVWSE